MESMTVAEIARRLDAAFEGDGSTLIDSVAGVRYARAGQVAFIGHPRYVADAAKTKASVLIVNKDWAASSPAAIIRVDKPEVSFVQVVQWFAPPTIDYPPGIHPTAVVAGDAQVSDTAHVGPHCVIGAGAVIGERTALVGHNVIGPGTTIGPDGLLYPLVSIREYTRIGARVILHNGVVIGSDGFGYDADAKGVRTKIPQIGIVEIGDDVEIGANSTVDRARFGTTRIGNGVKIDNLVMVAHNVIVGDHSVLVCQVGIAGSSIIGRNVILAGQSGVSGHIEIGDGTVIGARTGVTKNVPARSYMLGFPATPQREHNIMQANLRRLPYLKARVAELEERLKKLEEKA